MNCNTLLSTFLLAGLSMSLAAHATEDKELAQELLNVLKQRQAIYAKDPNANQAVLEELWHYSKDMVLVSYKLQQYVPGRD